MINKNNKLLTTISIEGFKRYFANTSWMMTEKIIRMFVTLFVGIYVARYLRPEKFGLLSYAMSFVALFSAVATLGLEKIVIRNMVSAHWDRDNLLGTAFTLKLFGSLLLVIFVLTAVQFTSSDRFTKILVLIIASGMLFQSFNVIDFYFQSRVLAKFTSFAQICSIFVSSTAKLVFIATHAQLVCFAWTFVLENFILAISLSLICRKQNLGFLRWQFDRRLAAELLRDSWPLIFSGLATMVYMRIDQIMIKEMIDSKAVGNYAAATRLSEAWYFIPMVVSSSLFPAIINARKVSEEFYHDRIQKLYDLMVWLAIAIAVPTTLLAAPIVELLLGNQYLPAIGTLKILIWAGVFVFLGVASGQYLIASDYMKISFLRTFFGAITNVVLNVILIPKYGINGAAFATLISYFAATFFIGFIAKTNRQVVLMLNSFLLPIRYLRKAYVG